VFDQEHHHQGAWQRGGIAPNILTLSPRQEWSALGSGRLTFREIFLQVSIIQEACLLIRGTENLLITVSKRAIIIGLHRMNGVH